MTAMRLLPAILCVLALPAAAFAATPTKDIKPYKTFRFEVHVDEAGYADWLPL